MKHNIVLSILPSDGTSQMSDWLSSPGDATGVKPAISDCILFKSCIFTLHVIFIGFVYILKTLLSSYRSEHI